MPILAALSGFGAVNPNIPFPTFGRYVSSPLSDFNPMYVNQWNLSIQKQIGKDWLVTANYLGTSTIHFPSNVMTNPAVYFSGSCSPGVFGLAVAGPCSTPGNANFRRLLYLQNAALGQ